MLRYRLASLVLFALFGVLVALGLAAMADADRAAAAIRYFLLAGVAVGLGSFSLQVRRRSH